MYRWRVWNILFRLHEYANGHATYALLGDLEAADRLTEAELDALQLRKLRELVKYCWDHVPYVRNRMRAVAVTPEDIRDTECLSLLPVMIKADVRANRESL